MWWTRQPRGMAGCTVWCIARAGLRPLGQSPRSTRRPGGAPWNLNVNGTMYVLKHAARELVRGGGGSFVGISSIAASNTHRWFGAYGVTKSAVDHMMKLAADELGPSWVRVNSIRPGLIRTDLVVPVTESPELSADYRVCTPLPRVGEVEDVANLAMFLLSDAASWITGQVINVDGGHMLRRGPDFSPMLEPVFGADGLRGVVG